MWFRRNSVAVPGFTHIKMLDLIIKYRKEEENMKLIRLLLLCVIFMSLEGLPLIRMGIFMLLKPKGQVFSLDFIISCAVFILAVSILLIYWKYASNKINETKLINDMAERVYLISEIWFRDGIPKYWNASNVIDIGLSSDHRFNRTKMDNLNDPALGYTNVKKLIGVGFYEYKFTVYDDAKNVVYSFGQNPLNYDNLVNIKRVGILEGKIVTVDVMVWI